MVLEAEVWDQGCRVKVFFLFKKFIFNWSIIALQGFPGDSAVKNPPANAGNSVSNPGSERSLEKEMAAHSSILA